MTFYFLLRCSDMMLDFTSLLCSVESITWTAEYVMILTNRLRILFVMELPKVKEFVTHQLLLHKVSGVVVFFTQKRSQVQFPLPLEYELVTGHEFASGPWLCEMVRGTYMVLCFTSWGMKIADGCPSRAKDKAQLSFLVTDK